MKAESVHYCYVQINLLIDNYVKRCTFVTYCHMLN